MGKKNRKSDKKKAAAAGSARRSGGGSDDAPADEMSNRVTMRALDAMSDDDDEVNDDGQQRQEMPPEAEWNDEARSLKSAIERGVFDRLLQQQGKKQKKKGPPNDDDESDDESSFEEVDLDDDDEEESVSEGSDVEDQNEKEGGGKQRPPQEPLCDDGDDDEDSDDSDSDDDDDDDESNNKKKAAAVATAKRNNNDDSAEEEEEEDSGDDAGDKTKMVKKAAAAESAVNARALQVVTEELVASKKGWAWSETFDVVPATPLPFAKASSADPAADPQQQVVDIHDDLQREVAFYDMALDAVVVARKNCKQAGIPFTRPDDFFAEMVKTDDHMAKVKDRLIFETKKMEAVAQRKSNKEQKLRSKEAHANRLAEKSKRKRDHMRAVDDMRRGGGGEDASPANSHGKNKRRAVADKKFGFGGKRGGRFKQNDPKSMNDLSDYNPRGNFSGMGQKKTAGSASGGGGSGGKKRRGKRARDASRRSR